MVYDSGNIIINSPDEIIDSPYFRVKLNRFLSDPKGRPLTLRDDLSVVDIRYFMDSLGKLFERQGYVLIIDDSLRTYIDTIDIHLKERRDVGLDIKEHRENIMPGFEEFRTVIDRVMIRTLRDRQLWDSYYMTVMMKVANFSVPGSGKTATTLGMFAYLKDIGKVKRILLIGPINCFGSWLDEYEKCFGDEPRYFNVQDRKGDKRSDIDYYLKFNSGSADLLMFNYESVGSYKNTICKNLVKSDTLVVLDEVHRIKAIGGKRAGDVIDAVKDSNYLVALTGTPIPNTYQDIYNLYTLIFGANYKDFLGYTPSQLANPSRKEAQDINDRLFPFFCRTTKEQIGVPKANEDKIYALEASESENIFFRELRLQLRSNPLALIIRILQMESDQRMLFKAIEKEDVESMELEDRLTDLRAMKGLSEHISESTKMRECINLAHDLVGDGKKVVIWCVFRDSITNLTTSLTDIGVSAKAIYGAVPIEQRKQVLDDFKSGRFDVLIANPHTLAESISIHEICHDAIYFEFTFNLVHLLQSKDRIHRLGLTESQYTQYHYLQLSFNDEGERISMDEVIYNSLLNKERVMIKAIEENYLESMPSDDEDLILIMRELFKYYRE